MRKIAVVYGGSSQHHRTYQPSEFAKHFPQLIPLRELAEESFEDIDVLLIPSQTHLGLLKENVEKIHAYAEHGGIVVTFGPQGFDWLPKHDWEFRITNFWWWLEKDANSGLVLTGENHDLFKNYLTLSDATWHQHGVYWPPEGSEVLVATEDGGAVFYIDKVSSKGTWINTTLDPDYHYGSYFMPATERFLRGFLPWLEEGKI